MPAEQFVALAGVVVTAITTIATLIFRTLFDAWRKGELIPQSLHEAIVKLLTDENGRLLETNRVLRREYLQAGEEIKRLNALLIDRAK